MRRRLASQVHGCCGRFDCRGGVRRCPRAELRPLAQEALVGPNEPRELDRNRGLHGATGHLEQAAHTRWAGSGCLTSLEPAGRRARAISAPHYTKRTSRHPSSPHQIGARRLAACKNLSRSILPRPSWIDSVPAQFSTSAHLGRGKIGFQGEVYFGHEIGGDIWVITVQGRGYDSQFYWNGRRDTGLPPQTWVFEGAGVGRPPAPTVTVAGRDDASGGLYDGGSGFDDTTAGRYDSGYGSSRQDKCDAGHPLITGGSVGQYFQDQAQCDSCRDAISAHDAHSCRECQFDLCSHCGRASRRAGRGYGGGGGGNTEGLLGGGNGGESGCPCLIM